MKGEQLERFYGLLPEVHGACDDLVVVRQVQLHYVHGHLEYLRVGVDSQHLESQVCCRLHGSVALMIHLRLKHNSNRRAFQINARGLDIAAMVCRNFSVFHPVSRT